MHVLRLLWRGAAARHLRQHEDRDVAISNHRLIAFDEVGVTLSFNDYRRDGPERPSVMTFSVGEFIRWFLLQVGVVHSAEVTAA